MFLTSGEPNSVLTRPAKPLYFPDDKRSGGVFTTNGYHFDLNSRLPQERWRFAITYCLRLACFQHVSRGGVEQN